MEINEVRTKYLEFMQSRGHASIPSASLVPINDPTTLFTGSGMQPLITSLLGEPHPQGVRLTNSQKCFRAEDIEEIGDNRHTTFFEMLGNWSLGDYFKHEQLPWFFEFLTQSVGLDPSRLFVTVFAGDANNAIPKDTESAELWQRIFKTAGINADIVDMGSEQDGGRLGMRGGRIFYYDSKKNWWSRAGVPSKMPAGEPGGPDSEVFYDFGTEHDAKFGDFCHPNCDCGRFMEIGNSVFMQYIKQEDGTFRLLPKKNVDFGGGLERITAASIGTPDVFSTDVFADIIGMLEEFSGKSYHDSRYRKSFRVIADHMRAVTFILGDGVRMSNTDQGYVARRLMRRAAIHAQKLCVEIDQRGESILNRVAIIVMEKYAPYYRELHGENAYAEITKAIWDEEKQFAITLNNGLREFEKMIARGMNADDAFILFTTYGFPFEMTLEMAGERGVFVNAEEFASKMKSHQELSRAGGLKKFTGGLADQSQETTRLHTAHHLLLKALQIVLGTHVKQRGSNITSERLRIDFSHDTKMTDEQKEKVEQVVNEQIAKRLPVVRSTLPRDEAEKLDAEREFGAKYPDMVNVYSVGPLGSTEENPQFDKAYSIEFCGGPHVQNTSELAGNFKIIKEEAVASGIRRIKAVLR